MIKNFLTVGGWTMLSRVLGLVRDQLMAAVVGANGVQDAYLIAARLPNMFRSLFGEGAFNATFVPMFTARLERDGHENARQFASEALSALVSWLLVLTVLGEICMPWITRVMASGYGVNGQRFDLAVSLMRITFPYLVLICAAALVAGVLNAMHRFAIAAAAYVAFNIIGITSIAVGAWITHDVVRASAVGITISGVVQFSVLFWAVRRAGMKLTFGIPRLTSAMRDMLRRFAPALVGSGVTQLNLTVDTTIASWLPAGSLSWIYFADRVNQLPLGVLGAAAGTTLLPVLTRHAANGERAEGQQTHNRALEYTLLLTLPACCGLMALAPEIIASLFGYGRFDAHDVTCTAQALRAYAIGLPAFILVKVLTPGFYAHGDTRTPVRIGFVAIAVNLALNLVLYRPLAHMGPPLASALAAVLNVGMLATVLHRRGVFAPTRLLIKRLALMLASALGMAVFSYGVAHWLMPDITQWHAAMRVSALGALIAASGALYLSLLAALGIASPRTVLGRLRRRRS